MSKEPQPLARPLPAINEMNAYFWCDGKDGQLHIMHCDGCDRFFHPYQSRCNLCGSRDVAPRAVSGKGSVLAVTVNHQAWFPHVPVPYAIALVELDEAGPVRMITNMIDVPVESVVPGLRVAVHFEQHGDIYVPLFRPEGA